MPRNGFEGDFNGWTHQHRQHHGSYQHSPFNSYPSQGPRSGDPSNHGQNDRYAPNRGLEEPPGYPPSHDLLETPPRRLNPRDKSSERQNNDDEPDDERQTHRSRHSFDEQNFDAETLYDRHSEDGETLCEGRSGNTQSANRTINRSDRTDPRVGRSTRLPQAEIIRKRPNPRLPDRLPGPPPEEEWSIRRDEEGGEIVPRPRSPGRNRH